MDLYLRNALDCSRITTINYSTSFSKGIKLLHSRFRDPVYAVYGFVRFADEIVDTFFEQDQKALLENFKLQTYEALNIRFSTNPLLHSFQWVVHQYNIDKELIESFLESMEMDLTEKEHSKTGFSKYVYGSAEVVGLMCLKIFCKGDEERYQHLVSPARRLGAAFQKVNFLRDLQADYVERGRTYFPSIDMKTFNEETKKSIEEDIHSDFVAALEGIRQLDPGVRFGVYLTYAYYKALLKKMERTPAIHLLKTRIRISNLSKFIILCRSAWSNRLSFPD